MKLTFTSNPPNQEKSDCLILGIFEDNSLTPIGKTMNKATNQYLSKFLKADNFKGEQGKTTLLHHIPGLAADKLLLVGLGDKSKLTSLAFSKIIKSAFKAIKNLSIKSVTCYLNEIADKTLTQETCLKVGALTAQNTLYTFENYKSKKNIPTINAIAFYLEKPSKEDKAALAQGQAIAEGMAFARNLGNEPGNVCTPSYLATQAQNLAKKHPKLTTKIINEAEMKKMGMGALLGVAQGSQQTPKLITMHYQGGKKTDKPYVFVGKGITFDSGGISIKPADHMDEMKWDMMGAATVFGVLHAAIQLNLPINIVGVIPSAENMPGGNAYKPGDILTSLSGQTIEIVNTDAEGRLILCDALTYASRFKPKAIIDIATLTGAIVVSLGFEVSGIFANNDKLAQDLVAAGDDITDRAWHLPLVEDYQRDLDSPFADMTNCGSRWGGAITAGLFLSRFTKDQNWAHIDNAGTGFCGYDGKGANGRPVALLVNYLLKQC